MEITPLIPQGHQLISAYGDGGFLIAGKHYAGSVLVFPSRTEEWGIKEFSSLNEAALGSVFEATPQPEILLLGCGKNFEFLPKEFRRVFQMRGIILDAMDTGAACRTHNILLTEGRQVVTALIAV